MVSNVSCLVRSQNWRIIGKTPNIKCTTKYTEEKEEKNSRIWCLQAATLLYDFICIYYCEHFDAIPAHGVHVYDKSIDNFGFLLWRCYCSPFAIEQFTLNISLPYKYQWAAFHYCFCRVACIRLPHFNGRNFDFSWITIDWCRHLTCSLTDHSFFLKMFNAIIESDTNSIVSMKSKARNRITLESGTMETFIWFWFIFTVFTPMTGSSWKKNAIENFDFQRNSNRKLIEKTLANCSIIMTHLIFFEI